MGVCVYPVCHDCKVYIDIHKSYPRIQDVKLKPPSMKDADTFAGNVYWLLRYLYFLENHGKHRWELQSDAGDDFWLVVQPHYGELYPHESAP